MQQLLLSYYSPIANRFPTQGLKWCMRSATRAHRLSITIFTLILYNVLLCALLEKKTTHFTTLDARLLFFAVYSL